MRPNPRRSMGNGIRSIDKSSQLSPFAARPDRRIKTDRKSLLINILHYGHNLEATLLASAFRQANEKIRPHRCGGSVFINKQNDRIRVSSPT